MCSNMLESMQSRIQSDLYSLPATQASIYYTPVWFQHKRHREKERSGKGGEEWKLARLTEYTKQFQYFNSAFKKQRP